MSTRDDNEIDATPLLAQHRDEANLMHIIVVNEVERGIWTLILQHFSK